MQTVQHSTAALRFLYFGWFGLGSFRFYFRSGFPLRNRGWGFWRWVTDVVVVVGGDVQLAQVAEAAVAGVEGGEVRDRGAGGLPV